MSTETINLTPDLYQYLRKFSLREPAVLQELRRETHKMRQYEMQISPEQGQFMKLLIEILGAKKTIDIGTFTGYSALVVALALPADGKVICCDISQEWTKMATDFWEKAGVSHKIELRIAPALQTLQSLIDHHEAGTFDFIFIDADKSNYCEYYEKAVTLVRQGGVIAVDNVLWGGDVADPENNEASTLSIRALNEKIFKDERVSMSMLPMGDGLTLARKK